MAKIELTPELAQDRSVYSRLMKASVVNPDVLKLDSDVFTVIFDFDNDEQKNMGNLRDSCKEYMMQEDLRLVDRACALAKYAHQGQSRESGERYTNHCFRVARILAEKKLQVNLVVAGVLHDVLEDSQGNGVPVDAEFIQQLFGGESQAEMERGQDIVKLLRGCLNKEWDINLEKEIPGYGAMSAAQLKDEVDRLTLLKLYKQFDYKNGGDPRVILLKLADRLDNMRDIKGKKKPLKRSRKAAETLEFFTHLAKLMGEDTWRNELADLSFQVIDEAGYRRVVSEIYRAAGKAGIKDIPSTFDYQSASKVYKNLFDTKKIREMMRKKLQPLDLPLIVHTRLPGIYAMYRTWENKEIKRGRFDTEDLYVKVIIEVPDGILQDTNLPEYVNKIIELLHKDASKIITPIKFAPHRENNKEAVFLITDRQNGLSYMLKIVTGSAQRKREVQMTNLYRVDALKRYYTVENVSVRERLEDFRLTYNNLVNNPLESRKMLERLRSDMGGITVYGQDPKDPIPLPSGCTVLDLAVRIRKARAIFLKGFWINDQEYQTNAEVDRVLQDGDRIMLDVDTKSDPVENVSPVWLASMHDGQDITETFVIIIRNKLGYFETTGDDVSYREWKDQITTIGEKLFNNFLRFSRRVVQPNTIDEVKEYLKKKLQIETDGEFFQAVAFGKITQADLETIALLIDEFTQSHYVVDFHCSAESPLINKFQVLCHQNKLVPAYQIMRDEKGELIRYFIPRLSNQQPLYSAFRQLQEKHGNRGLKIKLVTNHLPPGLDLDYLILKKVISSESEN